MIQQTASLLLTILLAIPAVAQTASIEGHITDQDGEPLPSATVVLEPSGRGTSADAEGLFRFGGLEAGTYTLRVSMIGFGTESREVTLHAGVVETVDISLSATEYHFSQDVVITATRTEQSVATAPASVSVVSGQDLTQRPVADLSDAIRDLPGISLSAGTQGRREIQIRGMESSYTLILVDGKRVNSSEAVFRHNDFDIGMLPVESIERIEVVRGGMSALYGSEALGGVINVITKPATRRWRTSINTEMQSPTTGGGGNEYRASLHAGGALLPGVLSMTLNGGISHRDEWHGWPDAVQLDADGQPVARPDGSLVNRRDLATLEGRSDHNVRGKLHWAASRAHTFEAEAGYGYQTRFGEYYISGWGNADAEVRRSDLVLAHRAELGLVSSEARIYGERVETQDELVQGNIVVEGNASAPVGRHMVTGGLEARWVDLAAPEQFLSGGASVHQQAVFVQDDFQLTEAVKLLGGARLDHHETFGFHLTPRAYAVYAATNALTFKAGVGTAFKAPTLRQISDDSVVRSCRGTCLVVGSDNLRPEMSTNVEASINLDTRVGAASITLFNNDVDNLIDTPRGTGVEPIGIDPETQLPMYVPRNVDRARIRGIESTARLRLGRYGRISANHTLLDARDLDGNVRLDYRPQHAGSARLDVLASRRVAAFVRGQYVGEQTSGDVTLDPYAMFDIGANVQLLDDVWINLGIQNIANKRTDDAEANYSFVERGRTVSAGVNARF